MENCLFCRIIRGEIPSNKVYEDEQVFAFRDINPVASTHVLVIPKVHVASVARMDDSALMGAVMLCGAEIARKEGLEETGYRLVINHGDQAGQTVHHLHLHVIGGREMTWPPG